MNKKHIVRIVELLNFDVLLYLESSNHMYTLNFFWKTKKLYFFPLLTITTFYNRQTHIQMDIATPWPTRPRWPVRWKSLLRCMWIVYAAKSGKIYLVLQTFTLIYVAHIVRLLATIGAEIGQMNSVCTRFCIIISASCAS